MSTDPIIPDPTPSPPPPAPAPSLRDVFATFIAWARSSPTVAAASTLVSRSVAFAYKASGPVALSLIIASHQGCVIPGPAPVPPTPIPVPPVPPPVPPPTPPPIPQTGFRVLIVYEDGDLHKMPSKQVQAIKSKAVLDYLDLRCVAEDGGKKAWRIWDQNISTANVGKTWQDAMALTRASLPWIVVSNGVTGFSGPLPADEAGLLDLLKKYGGV